MTTVMMTVEGEAGGRVPWGPREAAGRVPWGPGEAGDGFRWRQTARWARIRSGGRHQNSRLEGAAAAASVL